MKVCLIYDRVNKWGGAERVLLALHRLWPNAPLYTSVYSPNGAPWSKDINIIPSWLNYVPFAATYHEAFAMAMPLVFESFDLSSFDVIISVTSAEAKGVITAPHQLHLSYVLTPTRYLWSHTHQYRNHALGGLMLPFLSSLRRWDYIAARRPDYLIPISNHVAHRIQKYYALDPLPVIYPPVDTDFYTPQVKSKKTHHLLVSRLVGYKSVSLVIDAFRRLPHERLVIVGTGRKFHDLKNSAPSNVVFKGFVSNEDLRDLYESAQSLIFPQEEDFGIVAVEAQSMGVPVVAFRKGASTETVIEGKTGLFVDSQDPVSLAHTIVASKDHTWYDKLLRDNALRYSRSRFSKAFRKVVEDLWQEKHPN